MRKFLVPALAVLASCAGRGTTMDPNQKEIKAAFEAWRDATAAGNVEKHFQGLSAAFKSKWLYDRMGRQDPILREWRARLDDPVRSSLESWWDRVGRERRERPEVLPPVVLRHAWLEQLYAEYFAVEREAVTAQFKHLEVRDVCIDTSGITVRTRNVRNEPELFEVVFEEGAWKVNGYRPPLRSPAGP